MSAYPYAEGDRLVERNTYQYTPFAGRAFLAAWRENRSRTLGRLGRPSNKAPSAPDGILPEAGAFRTAPLLEALYGQLSAGWTAPAGVWLDRLVQRFEVTKRLHGAYGANLRAIDREEFRDLELYVRFAEVLEVAYRASDSLVYLNALPKVLDTLCSQSTSLAGPLASRVARLIEGEGRLVNELALRLPPTSERCLTRTPQGDRTSGGPSIQMPGVVILAARTTRTQAYLQEMARRGLAPAHVLFYGDGRPMATVPVRPAPTVDGVALPDLSVPVDDTVREAGWASSSVGSGHVNDPAVAEALCTLEPEVIVYSGYGGQIVDREMLTFAPVLHAHAGWLPDERGSTTLYYGALTTGRAAVSVLQLVPEIDAGPILARRRYPLPPTGVNADHLWDGAIRADLLCTVLARYAEEGILPGGIPQSPEVGRTYYIIHPVLKHLALLSIQATPRDGTTTVPPFHPVPDG